MGFGDKGRRSLFAEIERLAYSEAGYGKVNNQSRRDNTAANLNARSSEIIEREQITLLYDLLSIAFARLWSVCIGDF